MSTTNTAASNNNNNNNNLNNNINININNNCVAYLNSGSTNSLNGPVSSTSHVNSNVVLQTLRSRRANKVVVPLDERVSESSFISL